MKWINELSINDELRNAFELATLRKDARSISDPEDLRQVARLRVRCDRLREREKELYAQRYDTRVEARRRQLIDEAGKVRRDLRPWGTGVDRFDPDATRRQAHHDVRNAHAARIAGIDARERRQLAGIVERARLKSLKGQVLDDFERAADRRIGPERRSRPDRRRGPER